MILELISTLNVIAASYLLLFTIYLFTLKKGGKQSNVLLGVFFIVQSMCFLNHQLWSHFSFAHEKLQHFFFIPDSLLYLWGPALYFFSKGFLVERIRFNPKHLLVFVPMLLHATYMFTFYHRFSALEKTDMLLHGIPGTVDEIFGFSILTIHNIVYLIFAFLHIVKLKADAKNQKSNIQKMAFEWVLIILIGFAIVEGLEILLFVRRYFFGASNVVVSNIFYLYVFTLATFVILKAFHKPEKFVVNTSVKYEKSHLQESDKTRIKNQLDDLMQSEEYYTNPNLNLTELASSLNVLPKYLSQVINESYGKNFHDFVNSFRIDKAKEIFHNPEYKKLTVLEVLYDVGFNSKSSFNKAFKQFTNQTPTEFRKNIG